MSEENSIRWTRICRAFAAKYVNEQSHNQATNILYELLELTYEQGRVHAKEESLRDLLSQ